MKRSKFCIILMVLVMCIPVISCADAGDKAMNTLTTDLNSETTAAAIKEIDLLPSIDFEGTAFRGITENNIWWELTEITVDQIDGEVVNDAIYQRNTLFEEKFNIKLECKYTNYAGSFNEIKNAVLAQDDVFDFVIPPLNDASRLAVQGLLFDLLLIDSLDLTSSAWDQNSIRDLSVAHKLYFVSSDISLGRNESIWIYMFNKRVAEQYNIEDLYQTVKEGRWTFDKCYEVSTLISADLDGDGKVTTADQFGTVTHNSNYYGLIIAAGEMIARKDENDYPYIALNTPEFIKVYEQISSIMSDDFHVSNESKTGERTEVIFNSDRALFCGQVLACVRLYRGMESDFGILPLPKFNEQQENNYSYTIPFATYITAVPLTCPDFERTGLLLQALALLSDEYVTPAYYDVSINGKYTRDEESITMLDIILGNIVYDLGNIFDWGGLANGLVTQMSRKGEFVSFYSKKEPNVQHSINQTIQEFELIR
ncbi:MAG: hypothetical protein ACYCWE_03955 [Eubacteriales bacterium]